MRIRRNFQPSCSAAETLESRKLMDGAPAIAPPAGFVYAGPVVISPTEVMAPIPYPSGTPLSSVAPGVPVADTSTLPQDVLTYSIPVIGLGDPGSAGLLNVNLKIVDAHTGAVLFEQTQMVPVDGGIPQTVKIPVDIHSLNSGVYDVKVSAQDGSLQAPAVMSSKPTLIEVTAPETTGNPFTVAEVDGSVLVGPVYSFSG